MRIGIDCRLWNESGVGRYTRNLIKHLQILDKKNDYVLLIRTKDYNSVKYNVFSSDWKIVHVDIRWHTVDEQLRFPAILKKEKLDLVHFPYFSVPIFYNKPFVVTIHDLILHHFPTGEASTLPLPLYQLKLSGYKLVINQAAKKAAKIITVSEATKEEIVKHLYVDQDKVVVTYEGVDDELSSKQQPKSKKYFLYVGNAYPHKNLERLLDAFLTLNYQLSTINLVLVGKEDYFYKRLKRKVRTMGIFDNILFFGEANDEELVKLYRNAKALVFPSLMEGFGLPALEAMANGCLVICSDIPSLRETCGEAAIYFNPYDVDAITERMKTACFNDLNHFSKLIKDGFERTKLFSWEKMAIETLQVYQNI